jgi:serine/threonine protein kinase
VLSSQFDLLAVLDGSRGYTRKEIRLSSRYLVFRNHGARADPRSPSSISRGTSERLAQDVSARSSYLIIIDLYNFSVQDAPPMLDRTGGPYKYSRAFYDIVESCLIKDPARRPSAAQLLQTTFFRGAKRQNYLVNTVISTSRSFPRCLSLIDLYSRKPPTPCSAPGA